MKKVISLILSVAMLLSIVSVVDFSAFADVKTGKCGDNVTYSLDTETGVLTISGTGKMTDYSAEDCPFNSKTYKSVIIESGVTSIGNEAFYGCTSLTSVTIPDSVTSIGSYVFYKCTRLTSVTIPDSVTSIGDYEFYNCTSLTSVTIGNSVTSIGDWAFSGCYFTSENFVNNSNVELDDSSKPTIVDTDAGGFCIKDNELVNMRPTYAIGEVTTQNSVISIGYNAFEYCTSLTSVTIPDSVTSIGNSTFYNCTSLKSIEVSENNKNYVSVDGILFNKDKSELITYPAGKTDSEYVIPNSVTSIDSSAFENCTSLTSVTIPDSVTSIGGSAFFNCTSLASVTIGNSVTSIDSSEFKNCTSLTSVTIPNSVTSIGDSAFYNCTSLTSVTIPNTVTSIGDSAFYNCTSLTGVTIPNSVTSIDSSAFEYCTSLSSVTIPNSVTSIASYAFYKTAYYNDESNWDNGVLYISDCLIDTNYNFDSITDYIIKDGTRIIANCAFEDCTSLTSVTIPNSVTSIGSNAFYNTAYFKDKLNWENGVLYLSNYLIKATPTNNDYTIKKGTILISDSAFRGCTSLTSIIISDGVTSIGEYAFSGCTSLTSVTIPDSVTSIGDCAFDECKNLTDIYYSGTKKEWKAMKAMKAMSYSNYILSCAVIHCSDGFLCNNKTVIVDKVKYILKDENNACVDGYVGNSTSVSIPDKITVYGFDTPVTDIKAWTLDNLTDVYFTGTKAQWIELTGGNCYFNYIVHCSDGAIFRDITVTIDNVEYELRDDNTAVIIGYVGKLTAIDIPETISYKNEKLKTVSVDFGVFNNCSSLTDVYYTGTKEQWNKINFNENNEYLTSSVIHCSDGVIFNNKSVIVDDVKYIILDENNAYVDCYTGNSSSIKISDKITLYDIEIPVTSIGEEAFYGCKSSTTITIPKSITYISDDAFENCGFINVKYEGTTKEFLKIRNIENNKALIIGRHYDVFNFNSFDVPCKQSKHLDVSNYLYSFIPDLISKRSKENNEDVLIKNGDIYVDGVNVGKLDIYYSYFSNCYCDDPYGESCYESDYERLHRASIYIQEEYTDDDGAISYIDICHNEFKINFSNDSDYNESDKQYVNDFVKKLTLAKPQYYEMDYEEYTNELFNGNDIFNYIDKCASKYYNSLIDDPTIKVTVGSGAGCIEGGINPGYCEGGANLAVFKNNVFYGEYYLKNEYDENGCKIWSEGFIPVLIIPDSIANDEIESYILQKVKKDYEGRQNFKFNAISKGAVENGLPVEDGYTLKTNYADVDSIIIARRSNTQKPSTPAEKPTAPTTPTQPPQPSQPSTTPNTPTPTQPTALVQPTPAPTQPTAPAQAVKKPKSTSIKKAKGSKKAVALEWKKVSGVNGYQIQVATDKKFKKNKKTVNIKKQKTTKTTVKKLKAKKKYYVRIRTYKIVNGKKVYSSWSKVKSVKTK